MLDVTFDVLALVWFLMLSTTSICVAIELV